MKGESKPNEELVIPTERCYSTELKVSFFNLLPLKEVTSNLLLLWIHSIFFRSSSLNV